MAAILPLKWTTAPYPSAAVTHAVPHAVVSKILRPDVSAFLPSSAVQIKTRHDAHCCAVRLKAAGDATHAIEIAAAFQHLTFLNLSSTTVNVQALREVSTLPPTLRSMSLRACPGVDAAACALLSTVSSLTALDVSDNDAIDAAAISHFQMLDALRILNLSGCSNVEEKALSQVALLTTLRTLYLSNCDGVNAAGLAHLKTLRELGILILSGCPGVDGSGLAHVAEIPRLEGLHLVRCGGVDARALGLARSAIKHVIA